MKILFLALTIFGVVIADDELTGRWQTRPSEKGNITGVVFKAGNVEGYVNKKPFVSGTYSFDPGDSILSFVDNGCNGMRGIYKVMFYSNSDSLRFNVINDSCTERKNGMLRLIMGRVK